MVVIRTEDTACEERLVLLQNGIQQYSYGRLTIAAQDTPAE